MKLSWSTRTLGGRSRLVEFVLVRRLNSGIDRRSNHPQPNCPVKAKCLSQSAQNCLDLDNAVVKHRTSKLTIEGPGASVVKVRKLANLSKSTINQSINQSVNQSINQSINQKLIYRVDIQSIETLPRTIFYSLTPWKTTKYKGLGD